MRSTSLLDHDDTDKHVRAGMVYVLLPAKPVVIDGKELPAKSIH